MGEAPLVPAPAAQISCSRRAASVTPSPEPPYSSGMIAPSQPALAKAFTPAVYDCAAMAVQGLYALQNGFMGATRSLLFYGEFAEARTQIPITSYVVRTSDAVILYDTGVSPRAVPGLVRNDTLARFTD